MRDLVLPGVLELRPYEAGKPVDELERERGITDAIKLASNENPLGPSPMVREAITRAMASIELYPDASAHALRVRLGEHHGVSPKEIIHGAGSNEVISLLYRAFTTPQHHVVFAENAFVVYSIEARISGVRFAEVPLRDWRHDLQAMRAKVEPSTRLLFVANPNNPTGTHVGRSELEWLLRETPPEVVVVVDEAYVEYPDAEDYVSALELRHLRERLVVLRTFSKAYGLAALRVGYGVAPAEIVSFLDRVRAPFNVGSLGQVAALAALDDPAHVTRAVELNSQERRRVTRGLGELGVTVVESQANFVYLPLPCAGRQAYEALLERGVIVRPMAGSAVRVTIGTAPQNDRLLQTFAAVWPGLQRAAS